MDKLTLVGLSHKTAPIEVRERVAFSSQQLPSALRQLIQDKAVEEGIIVSTCNRVEVLARTRQDDHDADPLKSFLYSFHSLRPPQVENYIYSYQREEAVRHLFRVACSLDSMVVGETQILSQLKNAYRLAFEAGSIGRTLKNLLPRAFFVAKRVRTETQLSKAAVSISSVAVQLARKIFGDLSTKSILLVGAGKMAELAARKLVEGGVSEVFVANRSPEKSHRLAASFKGSSIPFDDLDRYLVTTDIALVSTGSQSFILDRDRLLSVIRRRKYRPLFLIDISVPRNVDPLVNEIGNIFLYDIDDLQSLIESKIEERRREIQIAEGIVQQEVQNYLRTLSFNHTNGHLVGQLRNRVEQICLEELASQASSLDPVHYAQVERILRRAARRVAHPLIMSIKAANPDPSRRMHHIESIKEAFQLEED